MNKTHNIISLFLGFFIVLAVSGSARLTSAQEEPEEPILCTAQIRDYVLDRENAYLAFLQNNFLNEAPNSDLLNNALMEYRDFTQDLQRKLQEVYKPKVGYFFAGQTNEYIDCVKFIETHRDVAKKVLYHHSLSTAQAKKSLRLTRKYDEINTKLRDMVRQTADIQGYLDSLNSKLPCYTAQCQK